jgi:hypothetical protein
MASSFVEGYKREAVAAVLTRLGEGMFAMLKLCLAQDHKINIDKNDSYTLEELQIALQKIVGPHGSSLLIREIVKEVEMLARQQMH